MPPQRAQQTRRRSDTAGRAGTKAHTRTAVKNASKTAPAQTASGGRAAKPGGRLKSELVLPVGVGAVVMIAALGIVAVGSDKVGAPLGITLTVAGILLVAGLVMYVAWVVDSVLAKPLSRVRDAMQEMEGGN